MPNLAPDTPSAPPIAVLASPLVPTWLEGSVRLCIHPPGVHKGQGSWLVIASFQGS